ncbi:MAG: hypothetical protein V4534_01305 [Myxococcota bacterium]
MRIFVFLLMVCLTAGAYPDPGKCVWLSSNGTELGCVPLGAIADLVLKNISQMQSQNGQHDVPTFWELVSSWGMSVSALILVVLAFVMADKEEQVSTFMKKLTFGFGLIGGIAYVIPSVCGLCLYSAWDCWGCQ